MKDFRDFVKATYAGLMEVEGLNESKSFIGKDSKKRMFDHPWISKTFSKENAAIFPASSSEIKRLGKNHAIVQVTAKDKHHADTAHILRYHVVHDENGIPTRHHITLQTHTYPIVVEHGKHVSGGSAEGSGEGSTIDEALRLAHKNYSKDHKNTKHKPKSNLSLD